MNWKNSIYKDYLKNGKTNYHYINLQYTISEVSAAIFKRKDEYHRRLAQKLSDPRGSSKTCWSILKRFYNEKKVSIVPPLLINNKLESDFKTKAINFNSFFASKCTSLYTIVCYPIHYNMFLLPGFPHFISMRKSY